MRQIKTQSNSGVALVYVLMALVFVGAVGMLVLDMAKKEKTDSGLRVSTEVARFSATAGLTYAASFFSSAFDDDSDTVFNLLRTWLDTEPDSPDRQRWLVGGAAPSSNMWFSSTSNMPFLEKDGMRFRVQIVNIDFSRLVGGAENPPIAIMLRSESIDQSGSRAENIGFYNIFGFHRPMMPPPPSPPSFSALHIGNGMSESNITNLTVNGSTFLRTTSNDWTANFNGTGGMRRFNGEFRAVIGTNNAHVNFVGPVTFNQPALFEAEANRNGSARFGTDGNRIGFFESSVGRTNNVSFTGRYGTPEILTGDDGRELATQLGMSRCEPTTINFNSTLLPAPYRTNRAADCCYLNAQYDTNTTNRHNGWLYVLAPNSLSDNVGTGPLTCTSPCQGFRGRMILHLRGNNVNFQNRFLRMTSAGTVVVIVERVSTGEDWSLAFGNDNMINGLILSIQPNSTNRLIVAPRGSMTINGAIHTQNAMMRFENGPNPNPSITINHDDNRIGIIRTQLAGIINFVDGECQPGEPVDDGEMERSPDFPVARTVLLSRMF